MPCLIRAALPMDLEFIVESNLALAEETERGELDRHVESRAMREPEVCGVRPYVHEANDAASAIYRHLDLRVPGYQVLQVDFHADADRER